MSADSTQRIETFAELLDEALAREKATGIEICTSCAKDMDFPSSLHVDHPERERGGAHYNAGGQTCASCAARIKFSRR